MHSGIWRYLVLSAPTLGLTILGSGVAARANRTRVIWLALVTVLFVLTQWWYIDTLVVIRGPGWSL
jgi:superfamily II DNA or RNA helicase